VRGGRRRGPFYRLFYRRVRRVRVASDARAGLGVVIPGYTDNVKTAISLPDDTYDQATRRAAELGISRSEFFARAARSYLNQLAAQSLTEQIDEALRNAGDDSGTAAAAAGRRYLAGQDDW
jgi:histone H3/H4